jgi:hypothetical protein
VHSRGLQSQDHMHVCGHVCKWAMAELLRVLTLVLRRLREAAGPLQGHWFSKMLVC